VAAAQRRGHPSFDLAVALPATAGGTAAGLMALLDRADELADRGLLLTLPAPSATREPRHRLRNQILAQLQPPDTDHDT